MNRAPLLALAPALLLAACAGPPTTPAKRYIGAATPSTPGPLCPAARSTALIHDGGITFAPDDGTWLLEGLADPSGTISAEKTTLGVNKQPWETTFTGTWTPTTVTGTYKTPRCTYAIALQAR